MSEECEDVVAHRNKSNTYFILSAVSAVLFLGSVGANVLEVEPFGEYSDEAFNLVAVLAFLATVPLLSVAITERREANKGCQHED
ncbi:MAG: hypothetical protein NBV63_00385 [Candidatus Pacebacteria bacterium]|jgi:ABC-type Fe3+ transport system permease subunit|nr:hypothetical protein [Candidatus Paceibacterota bacterium]